MTQQHYRLTIENAIALYDSGDITAKGLVRFYLLIKCAPGWRIKLDWRELKDVLPIKKTAFYSAISKLKVDGVIDWEAPQGITVSFRDRGIQSANAESQSANAESQSANAESQSANAESKPPYPALEKALEDRPDLYSSSIQLNYISLSKEERENFLIFSRKKAGLLPTPPTLVEKWIESQQQSLYAEYQEYQRRETANCLAVTKSINKSVEQAVDPRILAALENNEIKEIDYQNKMFLDNDNWWQKWHEWDEWAMRRSAV